MLFRCFGRAAEEAGMDGMSAATIAGGARDAYDVIRSLGGADRGDCTMLDALGPAVDVLTDPNGTTGLTLLAPAAASAAAGAEATASLRARRGRASYVGRAAVGVVDPGALVVAWLFDELAAAAAGEARLS
jgi:dihydroxyacetone kinase